MQHIYAQIDANKKVIGISYLKDDVNEPNMILISEELALNSNIFVCSYENGTFSGFYVSLKSDKPEILPNDIDKATVTAKVFDYLDNPINYSGEISFDVEGELFSLPATDGEALIEITSDYVNQIDVAAWIPNARAGGCVILAKNS